LIPLQPSHAPAVAKLHARGIPTGFISSLGSNFLTALYTALAKSPSAFGFVAEGAGEIVGFVAFTANIRDLYRALLLRHGLRFAGLLARRMLRLSVARHIFQNLLYPVRGDMRGLPQAELLSIVVSEHARGRGIAGELIAVGLRECARRRIPRVKVLVAAENQPANQLYRRCGFRFVVTVDSHGVSSNIYVAEVPY